ncbi:hypothetical protein V8E55_005707, partial [Tylopilus felleus]
SRSFAGRVQVAPAAHTFPTITTIPSRKGKEIGISPVHTRAPILPYEDTTMMDESTHNVDILNSVQGTLFPEFTGQEPLQNVVILGDTCDAKGIRTLFASMGDYVYAYQREAITRALDCYNQGRHLPTPSRWLPNAAICFDAKIMGPLCLFNTTGDIHTVFSTIHQEEEGNAPSYRQASNLITFLHQWRKHKTLEVSDLMRVAMKQWKLPVWASRRA